MGGGRCVNGVWRDSWGFWGGREGGVPEEEVVVVVFGVGRIGEDVGGEGGV